MVIIRVSSPEVRMAVRSAMGYLELGMPLDAWQELQDVPADMQDLPEMLALRTMLLLRLERWEDAAGVTLQATSLYPEIPDFFIHGALAFEKLGRTLEALRMWMSGPDTLKRSAFFHYNVARCEAHMGLKQSALEHLDTAIRINPGFLESARHDADLCGLLGN